MGAPSKSKDLEASDWAAARGEKWRARLAAMEAMLEPVDEPVLRALKLDAPVRVADIGCGGGGTTLEILRRAPAGSVVHGFDLSPALVEAARARTPAGADAVAFSVADAATTMPERPYDRLASRFGVMFFAEPQAAFVNLVRWLAPGGRLAFAVWAPPSENPWMTSVRDVVAELVDLPASEPDEPGLFRYADAAKLTRLLDGAGLGALEVRDWRGQIRLGGGLPSPEAADFALAAFSTFGERLAEAGEGALTEARHALTARLSQHEVEGVVQMDACVHVVTGERSLV